MAPDGSGLVRDLGLRAAGMVLAAAAFAAARTVLAMTHGAGARDASPREMALAAVAFLSASAAVTLLALGRHVLDRVEVSARWRQ